MTNKKKKAGSNAGENEQIVDLDGEPGADELVAEGDNDFDDSSFEEIEKEIEAELLNNDQLEEGDGKFAETKPDEIVENFSEQGQSFNDKLELIKSRLSGLLEPENRKKLLAVVILIITSGFLAYSWIFPSDSSNKSEDTQKKQDISGNISVRPSLSPAPIVVANNSNNNDDMMLQRNSSPSLEEKNTLQVPIIAPLDSSKNAPPPPPKAIEPPPMPQKPTIALTPPRMDKPNPPAPSVKPPILTQTAPTSVSSVSNVVSEEEKRRISERMRSSIMVYGGGGIMGASASGEAAKDQQSLGFRVGDGEDRMLKESSRAKEIAAKISNLDRTVIQGKLINAVLETAINTTLPGMLRAIVSRDVYAEQGKNILIPKGSRLIGSYSSSVTQGQTRIEVIWERLVTPRGIDLKISSPGSDNLGRNGLDANYNDMWITKLANALLVSYIIPRIATEISDASNDKITVTQNQNSDSKGTNGTTTTESGTANAFILRDSINKFQELSKKLVEERMATKPMMTIDQGESVTVLVSKDLVFPEGAVDSRG